MYSLYYICTDLYCISILCFDKEPTWFENVNKNKNSKLNNCEQLTQHKRTLKKQSETKRCVPDT